MAFATSGWALSAREAVTMDTPARRATAAKVAFVLNDKVFM